MFTFRSLVSQFVSLLLLLIFYLLYQLSLPPSSSNNSIFYLYIHYIGFCILTIGILFNIHFWRINTSCRYHILGLLSLFVYTFIYLLDMSFVMLNLFIGLEIFDSINDLKNNLKLEDNYTFFSLRLYIVVLLSQMAVILFFRKSKRDAENLLQKIVTNVLYFSIIVITVLGFTYTIANKVFNYDLIPKSEVKDGERKTLKQILDVNKK